MIIAFVFAIILIMFAKFILPNVDAKNLYERYTVSHELKTEVKNQLNDLESAEKSYCDSLLIIKNDVEVKNISLDKVQADDDSGSHQHQAPLFVLPQFPAVFFQLFHTAGKPYHNQHKHQGPEDTVGQDLIGLRFRQQVPVQGKDAP